MSTIRLKRVLITGASHGIGRAIALAFGRGGAEVVATDLDEGNLDETRKAVEETGAICRTYRLDVTDEREIASVRDALHRGTGTVDILVNNAGVVFGGAFLDVPLEQHRRTYRVNIEGMVAMTHAFLPDLISAPRGHLVNICSASGFIGLPNGSTYASSKWAAIGFTESIRLELKRLGHRHVDVTSVCPTYVATGMFEGAKPPKTTRLLRPETIAEKVVQAVERRKVWVLEPFIVKLTPILQNVLPTAVADMLSDAFGASSSMESWQGHKAG